MKKKLLGLTLSASLMALSVGAQALTVNTTVDATSNPWDITTNSGSTYNTSGSTGPTVVTGGGLDFTAGSVFNISYTSGSISLGAHPSLTVNDGNGIVSRFSGSTFPANSIASGALLGAIVGTFTDASGLIVGNPFAIGSGPVFVAPAGATQLLLGINDDLFGDNSGSFEVSVEQSTSAVPIPAAVWLFGSALVGLAGMRRTKK